MNRYIAVTIVCCALIVAAIGPGSAIPSFRGYTGLVKIPTADSLGLGQWNVGIMTEDVGDFEANDIFANYGIAENLEIGFNAFQGREGVSDRTTLLNAKFTFLPETQARPAVAVGITDITNGIDTTPYLAVSKSLFGLLQYWNGEITNIRGHIGLGGGQFDGVFLGFSAFLGNRFSFMFEWDSDDINLGARFAPMPGLRIHAALFDPGGGSDLGLGASFTQAF